MSMLVARKLHATCTAVLQKDGTHDMCIIYMYMYVYIHTCAYIYIYVDRSNMRMHVGRVPTGKSAFGSIVQSVHDVREVQSRQSSPYLPPQADPCGELLVLVCIVVSILFSSII